MSTSLPVLDTRFVMAKTKIPEIESINKGIIGKQTDSARFHGKRLEPGTVEWTARQLLDQKPESAIGLLKLWVHKKRNTEATHETIEQLNKLMDNDVVEALNELKNPKKYIRGDSDDQMNIDLIATTIDDKRRFSIKALLDCGCTGSCIDKGFIRTKGINTKKYPRPIPVYNADGTTNSGGPISEYVEMTIRIGNHVERLEFAVSNLGKSEMFIGYEWLKIHNPTIDWKKEKLEFNRCPIDCTPLIIPNSPEEEEEEEEDDIKIEDGERLFLVDLEKEIKLRAYQTKSSKLAEESQKGKEKKSFEENVPREYHEFKDVFSKQSFDELPPRRPWDHAIELLNEGAELNCKIYPLNLEEQKQLDLFLEENLNSGRIRPSKSPMASPFFFIKKKDGTLRPVQDYRRLNDLTIKNRYPLPLIQELVDKLKQAKYFTKLDVRWGFNNVRIKEGDEWKAAFRTNRGLFEPLVMFFGLTNSPATFQTMMNGLFREEINDGHVIIYMDDILIFTETLEEHKRLVRRVLQKLRENKLYLKHDKCTFEEEEVEYLGLLVSKGKVRMDPVKTKAVGDWPIPKTKRDIQQFLGFVNFYRRFIQGFAGISKPLTELTGKAEWKWGSEQQNAFDQIKEAMKRIEDFLREVRR